MSVSLDAYAHLLIPAMRRGGEGVTLEDVRAEIETGEAHLWPGRASAAVTKVMERRSLQIWLAGAEAGAMGEIVDMAASAEAFAREMGCDSLICGGRPGWARVLAPLGWRTYVMKEW